MVDGSLILKRLDEERRHLVLGGGLITELPAVTRKRPRNGSYYLVSWASLTPQNADAVIAQEIEYHRGLGVGFEWTVYAYDNLADLLPRLKRHGFEIGPRESVVVFDLSADCTWPQPPDDARAERIERVEQIEVYRKVAQSAFASDQELVCRELADALARGSDQCRGYIVYAADEPASVGRLYTHPQSWFGGLYGGGTAPAFRGRGLYRALVAARARDAIASGARFLRVDALPTSRPILERLGFQWVTDTWPCEWKP